MSAVVKDLLRKDIRNLSNVAVIATCRSRSSLHPVLVSSRGTHLVQEVINIDPPDQVSDSTELCFTETVEVTYNALTNSRETVM